MQNELTTEARLEIASRAVAAYMQRDAAMKPKAKVWNRGSAIRVYLDKGELVVEDNGAVTINKVGAVAAHQGVAARLEAAGLTVTQTSMVVGY